MMILISTSMLMGETNIRALKEGYVRQINMKLYYSNRCDFLEADNKDLKSKFTSQSNMTELEKEKKDVWKDQASRSWLDRLGEILLIALGIAIGQAFQK